jgi:hypothetical protein
VSTDVERYNRQINDAYIGRFIYLATSQREAGGRDITYTFSLLSTTPPSSRGSMEHDPTVSENMK